jgi:cytochrome c biogenesis protein CcdA
LGIVIGFILSFTFFTLFLSAIVNSTNLSADDLRNVSVIIILFFGISLLIPKLQVLLELLFSKLSNLTPKKQHPGFFGGTLIGLSLGLIWTPCVGPILASVITLAATNSVNTTAGIITLSYAIGTALPMLAVMFMGRSLFQKIPWLLPNSSKIQKGFGVIMILVAVALYFNIHRSFQAYILDMFPGYTEIITGFESNEAVKENLRYLKNTN